MKTILVIILSIYIFTLDFAKMSFEEAINKAKKDKNLVMLLIEDNYCPWCTKLKNQTLNDKEVLDILQTDYISIKFYKYEDIPKQFKVRLVPTIFIIDPENIKTLETSVGFISPSSLRDKLILNSRFRD